MWQNRLFELKYETCDEDPAHTSVQARRGGPSRTSPGVRGSVSSPHSSGGDQALLFVLVSLEPVGLSWILYTHVILSHHSGHLENTGSLDCANVNTVHYTLEKSAGRRHRALIWKVPVQDGSPRPRCRRVHSVSHGGGHAPSAGLPHERPRFPPSLEGSVLLLVSMAWTNPHRTCVLLCPLHLWGPLAPPIWTRFVWVYWPWHSRSLFQNFSCLHWCSCFAVAAG